MCVQCYLLPSSYSLLKLNVVLGEAYRISRVQWLDCCCLSDSMGNVILISSQRGTLLIKDHSESSNLLIASSYSLTGSLQLGCPAGEGEVQPSLVVAIMVVSVHFLVMAGG